MPGNDIDLYPVLLRPLPVAALRALSLKISARAAVSSVDLLPRLIADLEITGLMHPIGAAVICMVRETVFSNGPTMVLVAE